MLGASKRIHRKFLAVNIFKYYTKYSQNND